MFDRGDDDDGCCYCCLTEHYCRYCDSYTPPVKINLPQEDLKRSAFARGNKLTTGGHRSVKRINLLKMEG